MLDLRVLAAALLMIGTSACAKGTQGAIGAGGGDGGSRPSTVSAMNSPGSGGASASGGGSATGTSTLSGLPSTSSGNGGAGPSGSTTSTSTTASSTTSSTGSGGACSAGHLLISQVKTRGTAGGSDEFVELYNPTASAVTLDDTWTLIGLAQGSTGSYTTRWKGKSSGPGKIPAHGHYLLGGSAYAGAVAADDKLSSGIKDASGIIVVHSSDDVDYVCFGYTGADTFGGSFKCHGSPADNTPHDDMSGATSDVDVSIARKDGGCSETGSDANDFVSTSPSTPHNHSN